MNDLAAMSSPVDAPRPASAARSAAKSVIRCDQRNGGKGAVRELVDAIRGQAPIRSHTSHV